MGGEISLLQYHFYLEGVSKYFYRDAVKSTGIAKKNTTDIATSMVGLAKLPNGGLTAFPFPIYVWRQYPRILHRLDVYCALFRHSFRIWENP